MVESALPQQTSPDEQSVSSTHSKAAATAPLPHPLCPVVHIAIPVALTQHVFCLRSHGVPHSTPPASVKTMPLLTRVPQASDPPSSGFTTPESVRPPELELLLLEPELEPEDDPPEPLPLEPESSIADASPPTGPPLLLPQADEASTQATAPPAKKEHHEAIDQECIELSRSDVDDIADTTRLESPGSDGSMNRAHIWRRLP